MDWHYVADGASRGPLQEAEMADLYRKGNITSETMVWAEGMGAWKPLRETALAANAPAAGVSLLQHVCAECRKTFPESEMIHIEQSWVCASCKPIFVQRVLEGALPKGALTFASVGTRFGAIFIDGIILFFFLMIVLVVPMALVASLVVGPDHKTVGGLLAFQAIIMIFCYGSGPLYEIFFIGKYGATPGKMLMKIKVVMPDGGRVSYARATGRYFAKIISGMILYIGFLMAFWDPERRALHDMMCDTRVVTTGR